MDNRLKCIILYSWVKKTDATSHVFLNDATDVELTRCCVLKGITRTLRTNKVILLFKLTSGSHDSSYGIFTKVFFPRLEISHRNRLSHRARGEL
jgi:hypothetical protein